MASIVNVGRIDHTTARRSAAAGFLKVSSELHFRTQMEVCDTMLDREITDSDWLALIKLAWETAPSSEVLKADLEMIRSTMLESFPMTDKPGRAACGILFNNFITQVCWGEPGYAVKAVKKKKKKKRAA